MNFLTKFFKWDKMYKCKNCNKKFYSNIDNKNLCCSYRCEYERSGIKCDKIETPSNKSIDKNLTKL